MKRIRKAALSQLVELGRIGVRVASVAHPVVKWAMKNNPTSIFIWNFNWGAVVCRIDFPHFETHVLLRVVVISLIVVLLA